MENTTTETSLFDTGLDVNVREQLRGAAKWGGMAAIVSLIGSILSVISYFVVKPETTRYGITDMQEAQIAQAARTGGFVSIVIGLIIGLILFYLLNKFSKSVKKGLDTNDQYFVNEGLGSLSGYYKFLGVLLIIILVFFLLALLIGLAAGVSK